MCIRDSSTAFQEAGKTAGRIEGTSIHRNWASRTVEVFAGDMAVSYTHLDVDKTTSMYSILCAVFSLLFACLMCYLWVDAAKDRDNYCLLYTSPVPGSVRGEQRTDPGTQKDNFKMIAKGKSISHGMAALEYLSLIHI